MLDGVEIPPIPRLCDLIPEATLEGESSPDIDGGCRTDGAARVEREGADVHGFVDADVIARRKRQSPFGRRDRRRDIDAVVGIERKRVAARPSDRRLDNDVAWPP